MNQLKFDLSAVRYVKRIVVGATAPNGPESEQEVQKSLALLNRCLQETPRGHIMGVEKNFAVYNLGEHQVVQQWMIYHVGFARRPLWLND